MSFSSLLPAPRAIISSHAAEEDDDDNDQQASLKPSAPIRKQIPAYGQRRNFIPKTPEDYGDGGAFPEIHVAQYPLDMGRTRAGKTSSTIPLTTDASGRIRYDSVLKHADKSSASIAGMQTQFKDLVPMDIKADDSWDKPGEDVVQETTEKTRAALEKVLSSRITAGQQRADKDGEDDKGPAYIKYTSTQAGNNATGTQSRIIRMVEAPIDPLEPPRFKIKKMPRGQGSPPPPVMHSPPRKVSVEEQKAWYIPPTISNWKNAKGYTIPLDKRLAADGRGLQEITINDGFAKLSEALFIADRHAREEVRVRAEMQSRLAAKEKKEKEDKLRTLAQQARESRSGILPTSSSAGGGDGIGTNSNAIPLGIRKGGMTPSQSPESRRAVSDEDDDEDEETRRAAKERDSLRREQQKKREREMRMTHMGAETKQRVLSKSDERDISEKIALGLAKPTMSKEAMFDQRLFNQSEGIGSGFGNDDSYGIYDKALFAGGSASAIYRPKKTTTDVAPGVDTERIDRILEGSGNAPHRGFKGTEGGPGVSQSGSARDGPVQFEKEEADMFGIDSFLSTAKRGREPVKEVRGGSMAAAVAGKKEDYDGGAGSKRKMNFEPAGGSSSGGDKRGRY
ncbi:hypothetical protein SmJEL517_g03543 [Synchytrium microbalum]|uniref:Pre-mRNA-processing protein 45 n=1 Tax=Synchytrium microbalum TaxID=1806994 RepID=A0A507C2C6_9FUNG|nr:uncharacterized protein SmJEL517_g03543 [Synchytrium microbalum]TPX33571.1 hypothetical protein SmJEL517_g03543 [Synchytrium microbalum]